MVDKISIASNEIPFLRERLLEYSKTFEIACILDSNSELYYSEKKINFIKYDLIAGFSSQMSNTHIINNFNALDEISKDHNWYLGFLSYDLKNNIENLNSVNIDNVGWPLVMFFRPEIMIFVEKGKINIISYSSNFQSQSIAGDLIKQPVRKINPININLTERIPKPEYLNSVTNIKKHINSGDIYELNYCQEFYAYSPIDPYDTYGNINKSYPSPFSAFLKYDNKFLLSASPERFLRKVNSNILSQPIKGTSARGLNKFDDEKYKNQLSESIKERSENIMIVDLVRNDLSKIAFSNTVKVDELCEIYSFPKVHQMISTISARLNTTSFLEIIKATFPMGSMTGAPKISAMKIIDEYEKMRRGLYSGSVGYISPDFDFDFNVVIRSLQFNADINYVSYMTGSAITSLSDPEKEYEECLLKAYGLNQVNRNMKYA